MNLRRHAHWLSGLSGGLIVVVLWWANLITQQIALALIGVCAAGASGEEGRRRYRTTNGQSDG